MTQSARITIRQIKSRRLSVFFIIAFLFSLWDFYIKSIGIRILDFVGIGVLFLWLIVNISNISFVKKKAGWSLALCGFIFLLCIYGMIGSTENIKPALGILMGVILFLIINRFPLNTIHVLKALNLIITIHLSYYFLQLIVFYVFGESINIFWITGTEPRVRAGSIFRPTGLFIEPANYSLSILMLLFVRSNILKRLDKLSYLSILTVLGTFSLFGIISGLIFLVVETKRRYVQILVLAVLGGGLFVMVSLIGLKSVDNPYIRWVEYRITDLSSDNSAATRYTGLFSIDIQNSGSPILWIGKGISNHYHEYGYNGLAFLISAGGLVGVLVSFLLVFVSSLPKRRIKTVLFIGLFMMAAPIWTTFFWWLWLSLVLHQYGIGRVKIMSTPPISPISQV